MTNYQEALKVTLGNEGGWYDGSEARDPNPTMYGVTQRTYDEYRKRLGWITRSVRDITPVEVEQIYRGYWTGAACEHLGRLAAIALFDHSINAGPHAAVQVLQKALGVDADGIVGVQTLSAINLWHDEELADRICWERLRFYCDLAKTPRMAPNLLSWTLRVVKIREGFLR